MPRVVSFTGKHGAAALIIAMSSIVWVAEILRQTVGLGKFPGSYLPAWVSVAWFFCMLAAPVVSLLLAVLVAVDRREHFTAGFGAAVIYGCTPALLFFGYVLVLN